MEIRDEVYKAVRGFAAHGVHFHNETGDDQVVGDCPFTGKSHKFYVNWTNRLWDSKVAGTSGNFGKFLEEIHKANRRDFKGSPTAQAAIARDRRLPRSAFGAWEVGWDGKSYTLPVRNPAGQLVDLRMWKPGGRVLSTPGVKTGLFGHEQLSDLKRKTEPVYVCEGEWDAVALRWLFGVLKKRGIVVAPPGANTFKTDWVPLFRDRDVIVLYDNDEPGENGEMRCWEMLSTCAKSMRFVHWPSDAPLGFDVRDWVVYGSIKLKTPRACWEALQKLTRNPRPRRTTKAGEAAPAAPGASEAEPVKLKPISRKEMVKAFGKWLHMKTEDPLAILFGSCFANRLEGDPLWLFLVAPPGGMKSELLMALSGSPEIYSTSSLTPHALVSGASWVGGEDPSLIPKLDGKILVIKDFTTTLSMNAMARDEIFGQLRDCYDGKFEKQFGNGIVRRYKSTFGILAGVTPSIDAFTSLNMGLGERFLKFRLEGNIEHLDEEERIMRAIGNINREVAMRDELQDASARFLANEREELPEFPAPLRKRMVRLSMLAARMRGVVNRDRYNSGLLASKASYEIGTRLGKQLSKMAIGISVYFGEKTVSARSMKLVTKIALDTTPDKVEEILRSLYELCPRDTLTSRTKEVHLHRSRLTLSTVFRGLQDLAMTGVVQQRGSGVKYEWALSPEVRALIRESRAYEDVARRRGN